MIEKITNQNQIARHKLAEKINELVDVVNAIQKEREAERFEIQEWISIFEGVRKSVNKLETMAKNTNTVLKSLVETKHEEPADPFTEQRKWIGKLCKFWDVDKDNATYGILEKVVTEWACRFKAKDDQYLWDHCEPVKIDDDIIYKKENEFTYQEIVIGDMH